MGGVASIVTGAIIGGLVSAVGSIVQGSQQSHAQKRASEAQERANRLAQKQQEETQNKANQEQNRANKVTVSNFDDIKNAGSSGLLSGGVNPNSLTLGQSNALGSGDEDLY